MISLSDRWLCTVLLVFFSAAPAAASPAGGGAAAAGISATFEVAPADGAGGLQAGADARFRFRLSIADVTALTGARPAAWLDRRRDGSPAPLAAHTCTGKAAKLLGGGLTGAPALDLNGSYVLVMNEDASLSVVDARFGFGGSRLLARVALDSPAEDWALAADGRRLYVSMPGAGQVAAIDGVSWQIVRRWQVPGRPGRVALAPDQGSLWVTYSGAAGDGVAVVDLAVPQAGPLLLPSGAGPHALALADDGSVVFATHAAAGTVSVIDARTRRLLAEIPLGGRAVAVAWSSQAQLAYVALTDETAGEIVAVSAGGPHTPRVTARMPVTPGIAQLRFAPGGRYAFAVNPRADRLEIVDAATDRVVQSGTVHGGPDQVTFSSSLAYLRRRGDATVLMVPLAQIGTPGAAIPLVDFPGGQLPFERGANPSPADSIVAVPGEGNTVLVANPADRAVYLYQEGMAAPMGQFDSFSHEARALLVVDRSLSEQAGGVYETVGRLPPAGLYDVVLYLDSPRLVRCFELAVAPAPGDPLPPRPVVVRRLAAEPPAAAGGEARLRFTVAAADTSSLARPTDLTALIFLSPGTWQHRVRPTEVAPGIYEVRWTPPARGLYYIFLGAPSLGLAVNNPHALTFTLDTLGGTPRVDSGTSDRKGSTR